MKSFKNPVAVLFGVLCWHLAAGAQLTATVVDSSGVAVSDAVVALVPPSNVAVAAPAGLTVALDQVKKQFVPHVLAIQSGTLLNFPNSDNIRHQVYSFSDAKRFELKLYAGKSATPVLFDQPGVVVLGCNIHDWMSAYVYVLPTPYFAMTDKSGRAIVQLPPGNYTLKVWHPRFAQGREPSTAALAVTHPTEEVRLSLALAAMDDSSGIPPAPGAPQ